MHRRLDLAAVLCGAVVAAAGFFDGAHAPAPAIAVGFCFAALLAAWTVWAETSFDHTELLVAGVLAWGGVAVAVRWSGLLEAKITLASWFIAWFVWRCCRKAGSHAGGRILTLLGAAGIVVSCASLVEAIRIGRPGAGGFFLNPNTAAAILVPGLFALWSIPWLQKPRARVVLAAASSVMAAGVLATGSRAALLAMVVAVAVALPRGRLRTLGVTGTVIAAGVVILWRFSSQPDPLAWHRTSIWRALVQLVVEHPLTGIGPGAFGDFTGPLRIAHEGGIARHLHRIGGAESTILGIVVRLGLIGSALAAAAAVSWWNGLRSTSFFSSVHRRALLASLVVICLVHDFLDVRAVLWWWAALVGAMEATTGTKACSAGSKWSSSRLLVAIAAAGAILWAVVQPAVARQLWWSASPTPEQVEKAIRAERWGTEPLSDRVRHLLSVTSWNWKDVAEAVDLSTRAVRIDHGKSALWADLGKVHSKVIAEHGPWPDSLRTARSAFGHATSLEPHLPWSWMHWARLERTLGRTDDSRELAGRAVAAEPNFVGGWLFLARVELDRGHTEGARQALAQAHRAIALGSTRAPSDPYEEDLLSAPKWQIEELEVALR